MSTAGTITMLEGRSCVLRRLKSGLWECIRPRVQLLSDGTSVADNACRLRLCVVT